MCNKKKLPIYLILSIYLTNTFAYGGFVGVLPDLQLGLVHQHTQTAQTLWVGPAPGGGGSGWWGEWSKGSTAGWWRERESAEMRLRHGGSLHRDTSKENDRDRELVLGTQVNLFANWNKCGKPSDSKCTSDMWYKLIHRWQLWPNVVWVGGRWWYYIHEHIHTCIHQIQNHRYW